MATSVSVKKAEVGRPRSKDESLPPPRARRLGVADFARLFGTTTQDLPGECVRMVEEHDFEYAEIHGSERDDLILSVSNRISSPKLTVAGDGGAAARWERRRPADLRRF